MSGEKSIDPGICPNRISECAFPGLIGSEAGSACGSIRSEGVLGLLAAGVGVLVGWGCAAGLPGVGACSVAEASEVGVIVGSGRGVISSTVAAEVTDALGSVEDSLAWEAHPMSNRR